MRPTFVLSLDTELIWGSFDRMSPAKFEAKYPDVRGVISDIVEMLDQFQVTATWAFVGHLLLGACTRGSDGRAHPDLPRPSYKWRRRDWFDSDPCTDREHDPMWYGDDLLELVTSAGVEHEIGCHSFAHFPYGDPGCPRSVAAADLDACLDVAQKRGLTIRSFVYPRNLEGHHDVLRDRGIIAYRGVDPTWFRALPTPGRRLGHFVDQALGLTPPVSLPQETMPGLWNVPGSMLLFHRRGARRAIPARIRVAKARAGLERAVREEKVFHLWFHPFNIAYDRKVMFDVLGEVLALVAKLRDKRAIEIRTMGQVPEHARR